MVAGLECSVAMEARASPRSWVSADGSSSREAGLSCHKPCSFSPRSSSPPQRLLSDRLVHLKPLISILSFSTTSSSSSSPPSYPQLTGRNVCFFAATNSPKPIHLRLITQLVPWDLRPWSAIIDFVEPALVGFLFGGQAGDYCNCCEGFEEGSWLRCGVVGDAGHCGVGYWIPAAWHHSRLSLCSPKEGINFFFSGRRIEWNGGRRVMLHVAPLLEVRKHACG